jgi:hypothetical protein
MTRYACCNELRLRTLKNPHGLSTLNGIEYVEVRDTDESVEELRQRTLFVRLVRPVPAGLDGDNVVIDGGERIPTVDVTWAAAGDSTGAAIPGGMTQAQWDALLAGTDEPDHVLVVRTATRGDFSRYRLRLVGAPGSDVQPASFDPLLAEVDFWFKVECPSDFDCAPVDSCPPEQYDAPEIDYLAKDFQGFRRVMLERMSLLAPGWTERNPADVGIALVEMLAYAADELSYRQDAVATEAYLETARSRVSLRRLARLVDYRVHDGCNARAWVQLKVSSPVAILPAHTQLLTRVVNAAVLLAPGSSELRAARAAGPVVFETVDEAVLHHGLDRMRFYSWGDQGCCLVVGATAATLRGRHPDLRAGDVLVLLETRSPTTQSEDDADPAKRWAVRLVDVRDASDPSGGLFETPQTSNPVLVTEIRWADEDALPFPLCLGVPGEDIETAEAWGNMVLADHGASVPDELIGTVPQDVLERVGGSCDCGCGGATDAADKDMVRARFRPPLAFGPLTQVVAAAPKTLFEEPDTPALVLALDAHTFNPGLEAMFVRHDLSLTAAQVAVRGRDPMWSVGDGVTFLRITHGPTTLVVTGDLGAASAATAAEPSQAIPDISVVSRLGIDTETWLPKPDLLTSSDSLPVFTVESEYDGTARLRFGDDEHGRRPPALAEFTASYRVGNGAAGNVGAKSIAHVVSTDTAITEVGNPMPATGGTDPESGDEVRRNAPQAFATQQRAVTEADYAEVSERNGQVQRAAATFRWTGSWHTVFVTADRFSGQAVDAGFSAGLRDWLEPYRMAGYDLEVDSPVFVALGIGLRVCAGPHHLRSDVATAVRAVLSNGDLPGGGRGLFHPDNLTFGQPVYLSAVYAAVHSVPGVDSVDVHTFERLRRPETSGLDAGVLDMGRLEIARLDNDPNFPEHGVVDVTVGGGR